MRFFLVLLLAGIATSLSGADYEYTLRALSPNTHTYEVELLVSPKGDESTTLSIPSWRPGRYYEQDFAAGISHFEAFDQDGAPLAFHKTNKDSWAIRYTSKPRKIKVRYQFYANNMDSGSSYFDQDHYYFNPANLFMYVPGNYAGDVRLYLPEVPAEWKLASALKRSEDGKYLSASSYHEFVDSPTILAKDIIQTSFEDNGTTFYLHFHGQVIDSSPETIKAVADMVKAVAQEEAAVFGGYPFDEFHFLYRFLPYQLGHGVEHEKSTVISVGSTVTENKTRFVGRLQSLTAHELWHAWNVKRLRPAAMWPYDYSKPQYTTLHWFTEGVTDYYTQLIMYRAGLIEESQFFSLLAGPIRSLENNYATTVVSPSMSSYDAWLVRSEYGDPDHGISYYTLGSRVGFLMDMELRARTGNKASLDGLFRYLWDKYYLQGLGVPEDGIQDALETLSGSSWDAFFEDYVHGTKKVDYAAIFDKVGLELLKIGTEDIGLQALGILQTDNISQGILIRKIHPNGDAFLAGLGKDQLIIEIDGKPVADMDVDKYVSSIPWKRSITMKVLMNYTTVEDVTVVKKGSYVPYGFELAKKEKITKEQKALLADWMATKR
ncbi:MAG: hypothetical protein NWR72_01540 [Bacteroidia bacterium]|nr:hypothetical protein [Bacteroidia bacterium]